MKPVTSQRSRAIRGTLSGTRALRLPFALIILASIAPAQQTVTLSGVTYALQPHPRVYVNSALNARIAYSGGNLAPKAVSTNPPWVALAAQAANYYSSVPYTDLNNASAFQDGSIVALYAQYWYSDNTQTNYLTAALYLLNNIQQYVPLVCIESSPDCVTGGNGYWAGSFGPAYWMPNWIYAYELVRGQMTPAQRQTFADKFLNDLSLWGGTGLGGSASTSCTNPTVNNSGMNVTVDNSGVITASGALFGPGHQIQVGDWVFESNADNGAVIASVTNSTTATLESDEAYALSGYSGPLFSRRGAWHNGDCGWLWVMKHDTYSPYSIIQSTTAYPSGGTYGGSTSDNENLTLSQTYGPMVALLSLADDDVNFSSRDSVELTALYNDWYTNIWQGLNETEYTGFTPTGSVYGIWRAYTFYPLTAFAVTNSLVSPPPLTAGIWAKNMAHHFYLDTFPSCPSQEPEYGYSYPANSSYNNNMPWVTGMPALVTMYQGSDEGEYLNYWMQNIWSACGGVTGSLPGTDLMWTAANLGAGNLGNAAQPWFYLYSDPLYPTNSNLPTGSVDNYADNASPTSGTPTAGMMSRTGYSSVTDTLVMFYALATIVLDNTIPTGGFLPADYRIFKGDYLLADDDGSAQDYNAGGPFSMSMELGGDNNIDSNDFPWVDKMPLGHSDANYTYACTDSTLSYCSANSSCPPGANATAVYRCLVHFKKASTQDFVVAADYVTSSTGNTKQTYLHYAQTAYTGGGCTPTGSTSFNAARRSVTSTFDGSSSISYVDKTQLLTSILTPNSSIPIYAYVQNNDGTYAGGNGCTFRVSLCAATMGAPAACDASNTAAEFAVVHEPVAGSGNIMPSTEMLTTIDGHHRGIEIDGVSPKVFVYPVTMLASTYTSATFTTAHPGIAQYVVSGLTPGTYNVTVNGNSVATGQVVGAGDTSLYFESASGSVVVSQGGVTSYTLSTSTAGTGAGTVSGCAGSYQSGAAYSCTASAGSGSAFAGWSGTCGGTGSGSTYAGNMPASNCTVTATFNVSLAAPTGLTATPGNAQVTLTWTASAGAASYNVYRGTAAGGESATAIATGVTATSYTNSGLTNGTAYFYKVAAVNAGGTIAMSTEASATPQAPAPASITAGAGGGQSAVVNTAFATALQAIVKDRSNNPVSGATVTFTAPSSGASCLFGRGTTATATTNAAGIATAPAFTANGTAGGPYSVTASVPGVSANASYALTNTAQAQTGTTTQPANASATYRPAAQTVSLTAAVSSSSGAAGSGTVTFAVGTLGTVSAPVAGGQAAANFQVPAGTKAGAYTITATYSGSASLGGSSGTSTLTVAKATPAITWATPADIQLGSALGADEFNATANVPGTFAYTPPAGTVLLAGDNQTLRADFTPTDAADYTTASKTVTINVKNAAGGPVNIVTTYLLTRDPNTNEIVVQLTLTNPGGSTAANVKVTLVQIGTTLATSLPVAAGAIVAGGTASATVRVPGSAGASGTRGIMVVNGTYTGATFQSQSRVVLP